MFFRLRSRKCQLPELAFAPSSACAWGCWPAAAQGNLRPAFVFSAKQDVPGHTL